MDEVRNETEPAVPPATPPPAEVVNKPVRSGVLQSVRTAIIGVGQCGDNIAEEFFLANVPDVGMINTAMPDMAQLKTPRKLHIGEKAGGASKNPDNGYAIALDSRNRITQFCEEIIGDADQVLIPFGGSGGTGAGSFPVLVECADRVMRRKHTGEKRPMVGAIIVLPSSGEGPTAFRNAHRSLKLALELVDKGTLSPLIIVNNAALQHTAPVRTFYHVVNAEVVKQLVRFNATAAIKEGGIQNFDRADYLDVFGSGVVNFGFSRVKLPKDIHLMADDDPELVSIPGEDVSEAIANTLKVNQQFLLGAEKGAALFVGCTKVLDHLQQASLEKGFEDLQDAVPNALIHRGIYIDDTEKGLIITAMIGGKRGAEHYLDALNV